MTNRSIRRAAERKAKKLARKAARQAQTSETAAVAIPTPDSIAPVLPEPAAPIESQPQPSFALRPFPVITPAQLAANRANAQLSTGPRTAEGKARSSLNAVKSGLTGRTVLLPGDDAAEYAAFASGFQRDFAPVGQAECELVQSIIDTRWRLRRIRALEFALYAQGHLQFEAAFDEVPENVRPELILLQTHMTYEKQFRNFHIQESRLERRYVRDMAELRRVQSERRANQADEDDFADLDALVSSAVPGLAAAAVLGKQNGIGQASAEALPVASGDGFDFSTTTAAASGAPFNGPENPFEEVKAA